MTKYDETVRCSTCDENQINMVFRPLSSMYLYIIHHTEDESIKLFNDSSLTLIKKYNHRKCNFMKLNIVTRKILDEIRTLGQKYNC